MIDPRSEALQTLDQRLSQARKGPLSAEQCQRLIDAVAQIPGRLALVAHTLSAQRDAAAVDALFQLPVHAPGVIEGLYGALADGVCRRRPDGTVYPHLMAIDFRRSRARSFTTILHRATQVFDTDFECLDVAGQPHYRISIKRDRGTFAGRISAKAQDIQWLHGRLGRLKGTRLWLNGWCFAVDGAWRAPIQVHLLRGWLQWAASQTETQR